jgi:hypothetical protein
MKRINQLLLSLLLVISASWQACNDFDELNTNPTKSSGVNPNSQLTYVQLLTWGDWVSNYTYYAYCSSFAQQLQGEWNVTQYGGQYRRSNEILGHVWNRFYGLALKELVDIIDKTNGKPEQQNIHSVARIFKAYYFMTLTDLYGDAPYFNAGKGYIENNVTPVYDKQEDIYKDILKELKEAEAGLNANGGTMTGDIIHKGDIAKWKRFANSLRLRAAMRVVYAAPELAKAEVIDILTIPSGLLGNTDNTYVQYLDINDWGNTEFRRNALAQSFRSRDTYPGQFICSVFWNYLRTNNDPRLLRIARNYEDTKTAANNPFGRRDLTDEIIATQGYAKIQPVNPGYFWYTPWPAGYWSNITNSWHDKTCRPQINNAFLKGNAPGILMSYAEVQFLLAEAKARWGADISGSSAETHYKNGISGAMNLLSLYEITAIPATEVNNYINAHPFPADLEAALKVINEQLWVLHFNNPPEAYANWRRSGYPVLQPSVAYGAITVESQTIPRRLNYPMAEASYNTKAFNDAIALMGGSDNWNAKVWWDKK